jgi:hypothetical protein
MPNTRIYPQLTTDQLNAAIDQAFAAVDPVGLQQELEYFQWKLASVFKIPRRFLGLTDEELATNSEYQRAERRRAERTDERQNSADRYQRYIDTLMSVQPLPAPTGILYWLNPTLNTIEKPLSGGFAFKLKRLNFGLTYISL